MLSSRARHLAPYMFVLGCLVIGLPAGFAWPSLAIYRPAILSNPTPQRSAFFGIAVAGAGDVDGDGAGDFLVGAPGLHVGGNREQGQVFVFSGADRSLLYTLDNPTPQAFGAFGRAVAGARDVDGDGTPDVLVGAPHVRAGDVNGKAFVFSGADGSLIHTFDTPTPQREPTFFGWAVAGAGDVDGDGTPDLLVGAQGQDAGGNREQGQVFIFSGADGSLLQTLDTPRPQVNAFFGWSVAGPGDVDGDGVPDILVGAVHQHVGPNEDQGQAFVFSGADGSLLHTLDNPTPQQYAFFGWAVAGPGDVDGDGAGDLLVGARGQEVAGNDDQGQAYVFGGADGNLLYTLDNPSPQPWGQFGWAVAGAGDVDSDGVPDLLVGASHQRVGDNHEQGQAFVFSGADGGRLHTLNTPIPEIGGGGKFGSAVAGVGDVNGDGTRDLLVGTPFHNVGDILDLHQDVGQGVLFVSSLLPGPPPMPCDPTATVIFIDPSAPACRCFEDRILLHETHCAFISPDLIAVWRMPFPILPNEPFRIEWVIIPTTERAVNSQLRVIPPQGFVRADRMAAGEKGRTRRALDHVWLLPTGQPGKQTMGIQLTLPDAKEPVELSFPITVRGQR